MLDVSVIIPVYNASRFLRKSVESALRFEEVKEIILAEDCSTDNSLKICENWYQKIQKLNYFST
jgi:glycosyltransferase involved in cell wall biosynthesis